VLENCPTSLHFEKSTKPVALARRMSFIATYGLEALVFESFERLRTRLTLPDGFARSTRIDSTQNYALPCRICLHFADCDSDRLMMPLFWMVKLDSFGSAFPCSESLRNFLNSQPSLTKVILTKAFKLSSESSPFEETYLPNLTQVVAVPSWLPILIPGRPVGEVTILERDHTVDDFDFNFFTLSTAPTQKLFIPDTYLYPKSGSLLASVFPSLLRLTVNIKFDDWLVRHLHYIFKVLMLNKSTIIVYGLQRIYRKPSRRLGSLPSL
jgi:hypothetical protein